MTAARASALYVGSLRHRRFRPRAHAFRYGVYHALLDLDELDALDRDVRGFGHNRPAVTTFHDTDHLGDLDLPVREKLSRWLDAQGVALPPGPVRLLTNLRVLGHVFNPVSWFFCHDAEGRLVLVVAEVNNTFGETYCYLLDDLERIGAHTVRAGRQKVFHVSPFMDIPDHRYRFTIRPPAERVAVQMDVADAEGVLFDATLAEQRRPFTTAVLWRALLRYPLMPLVTVVLIHWQALRLLAKRVPVFRKPPPPDDGLAATRTGRDSEPHADATPTRDLHGARLVTTSTTSLVREPTDRERRAVHTVASMLDNLRVGRPHGPPARRPPAPLRRPRPRAVVGDPGARLALLHRAHDGRVGRRRGGLHGPGTGPRRDLVVADPPRDRQPSGAPTDHAGGPRQHRRRQAHPRRCGRTAWASPSATSRRTTTSPTTSTGCSSTTR